MASFCRAGRIRGSPAERMSKKDPNSSPNSLVIPVAVRGNCPDLSGARDIRDARGDPTGHRRENIMGSKKTTTAAAGLPALKIGGRVRRTDNLAEGRIVWANGVSVRIAWDEGEHVTWRRVSMAERPIEIPWGR